MAKQSEPPMLPIIYISYGNREDGNGPNERDESKPVFSVCTSLFDLIESLFRQKDRKKPYGSPLPKSSNVYAYT